MRARNRRRATASSRGEKGDREGEATVNEWVGSRVSGGEGEHGRGLSGDGGPRDGRHGDGRRPDALGQRQLPEEDDRGDGGLGCALCTHSPVPQ